MNSRLFNFNLFGLATMALGLLTLSAYAAAETESAIHDGKVVSLDTDKLVMTNQGNTDGKEHTHLLPADVKLTLDGQPCQADAINKGTKIRVTTKAGAANTVTHIEAIQKNATFANTHDGKFVSTTNNQIVMSGKDGQEHAHTVTKNARVCCDGKECLITDLTSGMKIRVTTKPGDESIAIKVEALSKNLDFASL